MTVSGGILNAETVLLPNYGKSYWSPAFEMGEFGLAVVFAEGQRELRVGPGEPCPVHGAFALDRDALRAVGKDPLSRLTVTVTNQHSGQIHAWPVISGSRVSLASEYEESELRQIASVGGYFNIDLKDHCGDAGVFGRFWVVFQVGRYLSDVLELEIYPPHAAELARQPIDLFAQAGEPLPGGSGPIADEPDDDFGVDEGFGEGNDETRAEYGMGMTAVVPVEEAFGEEDDATRLHDDLNVEDE